MTLILTSKEKNSGHSPTCSTKKSRLGTYWVWLPCHGSLEFPVKTKTEPSTLTLEKWRDRKAQESLSSPPQAETFYKEWAYSWTKGNGCYKPQSWGSVCWQSKLKLREREWEGRSSLPAFWLLWVGGTVFLLYSSRGHTIPASPPPG